MQQAHVSLLALIQLKMVEKKKHPQLVFIEEVLNKIQEHFWGEKRFSRTFLATAKIKHAVFKKKRWVAQKMEKSVY